jgi:hypothetical protein
MQFRYGEALIQSELRAPLAANQCIGRRVLLAHVDGNPEEKLPDGSCPITLCRYGILEGSAKAGSYYVLKFRLAALVFSRAWNQLQDEIEPVKPRWNPDLGGLWCFETGVSIEPEKELDTRGMWEAVIRQLWRRPDFRGQHFFFALDGLYARKPDGLTEQTLNEGEYRLEADQEYELQILHWHPEGDSHTLAARSGMIVVKAESPQIHAITSPTLPVDSPYDLKAFRIRTALGTKTEYASLVVRMESSDAKPLDDQPELYIPIQVQPSLAKVFFITIGLAAALWLQQLVPVLIKQTALWAIVVASAGLALLASVIVIFGLKKPLS